MAHAQKPDFVFPRNGRIHSNRLGRQFSRLLAAEVCASALVMLDIPRSEVAWEYWLPTLFASFPFTSPPVRHRVPPGTERALRQLYEYILTKLKQAKCRSGGHKGGREVAMATSLNFVRCLVICGGPGYGTCLMSHFWPLKYRRIAQIFFSVHPCY